MWLGIICRLISLEKYRSDFFLHFGQRFHKLCRLLLLVLGKALHFVSPVFFVRLELRIHLDDLDVIGLNVAIDCAEEEASKVGLSPSAILNLCSQLHDSHLDVLGLL
mmetsp:Transcript_15068/g.20468  ORF Transcript_15068/g.20468 Transcript_15068/m.20468 type:complete len:107 (-) Transcript_15068:229-549(-)